MSRTARHLLVPATIGMVCAMLLSASTASAQAGGPVKKVSTAEHPYLLFTMEELPQLRANAKRIIPESFHSSLKRKMKRVRNDPGFMAFAGVWMNDQATLDRAKAALLKRASASPPSRYTVHTGTAMRSFVYGYDLLYPQLTPDEREKCKQYMVGHIRMGLSEWAPKAEQQGGNWQASIYGSFVAAGLALIDELPEAKDWVSVGMKGITTGYLTMTMDPEGATYGPYVRYQLNVSFYSMLPAMEAYKRVTGDNPFAANDSILYRHMAFYAYMLYPNRKGICNFGNARPGLYPIFPYLVKTAGEYKDGVAGWYLKAHIADGVGANNWGILCYFLWAGGLADVTLENPDKSPRLPLGKAYIKPLGGRPGMPSTGHIFMRTGFARKDDIQFAIPGNIGGHHGHADKGSYIFNALGETFIQDPYLHEGSYRSPSASFFRSDECHNTVFIDDGGQSYIRGGGLRDKHYGSYLARVEQFNHGRTADYARINLKRTYELHPKNKSMKRAVRHVVFLRGKRPDGAFVIIDDFQKDNAAHVYSHNFQPGPDVRVASTEGGRIVLKGKSASCLVAVIHPDKVRVERKEKFKSKYLKAICEEPEVRVNLVTVLYPTRGDPTKAPISKTASGGKVVVRIGDRTVVFDKASGKVTIDGKAPQALSL